MIIDANEALLDECAKNGTMHDIIGDKNWTLLRTIF
jgi:hypothetical protein